MKIITAEEMKRIEELAFRAGASAKDFMEAAGEGVALLVKDFMYTQNSKKITLLCGKGNNGGDAYVAGIHLLKEGFSVDALQIASLKSCSPLCLKNGKLFRKRGGKIVEIESLEDIVLPKESILLDGLIGTGFQGETTGLMKALIDAANKSCLPVISIDIPSGLNVDTGKFEGSAIRAAQTIFLGLPKMGCFLDGWKNIGRLARVDFGLEEEFAGQANGYFEMLTKESVIHMLPPIVNDRHKYEAGYVVGLAGSANMPGAAVLSSFAALRGGAGIVRLLHPKEMCGDILGNFPEIIRQLYCSKDDKEVVFAMNSSSATFVGPGIGRETQTRNLLIKLLAELKKPCVIDADALNIIAKEDEVILPRDVIMTPHLGEMHRLLGLTVKHEIDEVFLLRCREYCEEKCVTLILKGGPTFIFHPGSPIYVDIDGDPGMATAGSGDVLTGLLAALLAQGMNTKEAALLGTYIHALAGREAAIEKTSYSMVATDIIDCLPHAFKKIICNIL